MYCTRLELRLQLAIGGLCAFFKQGRAVRRANEGACVGNEGACVGAAAGAGWEILRAGGYWGLLQETAGGGKTRFRRERIENCERKLGSVRRDRCCAGGWAELVGWDSHSASAGRLDGAKGNGDVVICVRDRRWTNKVCELGDGRDDGPCALRSTR